MYDKFMIVLGILMPFFNLPHILKMISLESSAGQSFVAVLALTLGFVFFFIYGIKRRDKVIMVTYGAAILMNILYLSTIYLYI